MAGVWEGNGLDINPKAEGAVKDPILNILIYSRLIHKLTDRSFLWLALSHPYCATE